MAICNISSENKASGNDADYEINLKRPLQRCIGVQILNVTVPLSYNIINPENNKVYFTVASHGTAGYNGAKTATLTNGNYTPDEFAKELSDKMNVAMGVSVNPVKSQKMYDLVKKNKRFSYDCIVASENTLDTANQDNIAKIALSNDDLSGLEVYETGDTSTRTVIISYTSGGTATNKAEASISMDATWKVYYEGIIVIYDENLNNFIIGIDDGNVVLTAGLNSTRMLKTMGYVGTETATAVPGGTDPYRQMGEHLLYGTQTPELSGPSMLFLRLGGDMILDQQNSETSMNDRIPIPINQPHGGVVHYENDSEADVIPFAVPCDVRHIKVRLEYGDDNTTVGGDTQNLRGHHQYVRLKFYKQHQADGRKM